MKPMKLLICISLLLSMFSVPALAADPVNLTPETTGISTKSGSLPFYANFAKSQDGRVIAQVFYNEESRDIILTYSNNWGVSWKSKKLENSGFTQPSQNALVSHDGSTISVFWTSGSWHFKDAVLKNLISMDSGETWNSPRTISSNLNLQKIYLQWNSINVSGSSQVLTFLTNAVANAGEVQELYIVTTSDQGKTWNFTKSKAINLNQLYGDAIVSNDGTHMAYIYESYGDVLGRGHFNLAVSLDAGKTWSDEWIALQNPARTQGLEFLYYDENRMVLSDSNSEIQTSSDNGKNFVMKSSLLGFLPDFVVSNDGMNILAVTSTVSSSGRNVNFSKSTDGGFSWSQRSTLTSLGRNSNVIAATSDLKTIGVVWSNWVGNGTYLQISSDSGKTWSAPIDLLEIDHMRVGAVGYRMDSLVFDATKNRVFFAYQDLVVIPYLTGSLRGVEIPLYSVSVYEDENTSRILLVPGQSKYLKELLPTNLTKQHFKFVGWSLERVGSIVSLDDYKIERDFSLYPFWEELPKYTLEYSGNGVLDSVVPPKAYWLDESLFVEEKFLTRTGFQFQSWNTKADGTGVKYLPGQAISGLSADLKLYAIGEKKTTITCVKGKLTKKVTAVKPKCPSGYKVKK